MAHSPDDETRPPSSDSQAVSLGPYRLLQRIGEGGMGEVWLAEQSLPLHRRVAVKLIKAGMDSRDILARFDAERQALALMDHESVAKVFDAGSTPQGRPFFVMEYVKGDAITDYADRERLTIRERVALFLRVCEGVQHAHQKGIIHRDLKPSNVLVAEQDNRRIPKIIDFGVAKATATLTGANLYTELGAVVGTLEYMSPEQANLTAAGVDTRADIYSLGVILYELLTGALPFDTKSLRASGLSGAQRTIATVDPPRPSTQVAGDDVALKRRSDTQHLTRQLRGDLDWVILKALEKERTRRYQSASEFAADLQRHLDDRPVLAARPNTFYTLRKFARRHAVGVSAAGVLALVVALSIGIIVIQARRVAQERDRANAEAQTAQQVTDFLVGLFTVPDPGESRGNSMTAREVLDKGRKQIEGNRQLQPVVQARLQEAIASTYSGLGLYAPAQEELEQTVETRRRSMGPEHPDTLRSMAALGAVYVRRQQYPDALKILREASETQLRVLGPDHPDYLSTRQDLGYVLAVQGQLADAETIIREALAAERGLLGDDHPQTITGMSRLASVLLLQGRYDEQEPVIRERVERLRRLKGPDHPDTLSATRILASNLSLLNRLDEAERLYRDVLDATRRVLGPDHPNVAAAMIDLGNHYRRKGDGAAAEQVLRGAVAIDTRALGPESDATLLAQNNLATALMISARNAEAREILEKLLEVTRRVRGLEHQRTLMVMANLGLVYAREKRLAEATKLLRDAIETGERTLGAKHPLVVEMASLLPGAYALNGRTDDAILALKAAIERGYRSGKDIRDNDDLAPIRNDPRYVQLLESLAVK